ncbi:hypothetical protein F889_00491 [Acinetobacter colistiniresistens]|uniref:Methyl-coenzyme M reductase n=1 Tax=Acinetobacter colistiniresistens TaxID=280145 RepID=N9PRY0_9GAMM|nr:hypothetical protein [Acinetobacter colistiniresistens]ENX36329.1 hypothetical protein F889_00491 [Acinetobacter colistiniresistens]
MAIIPRSQGRVSPQPTLQQQTPLTGLSAVGRSIGGVLQAKEDFQDQQAVTAKNIELFNNQLSEKEGQVQLDDFLSTKFAEKTTLLRNDVANGVKNSQQANEELKSWTDEQYGSFSQSLPMHAQHLYRQQVDSAIGRQGAGFLPLQLKADEQKGGVLADRFYDISTRLGRDEGRNYLVKNLAGLPLSDAQKSETLNKYETTRDITDIDSQITKAISSNDIEGLQALSGNLKNYKYINGSTAQKFETEIQSKISTLQQRHQVAENKRVNEAEKVLTEFKQNVLTGRGMDLTYQNTVEAAVKGTPAEAEYQFYKKQSSDFIRFSKLNTVDQIAEINKRQVAMKQKGSADAVAENKILSTYQSIYDNKLKTNKENPAQALREKGIELPEINALSMKVNPSDFAQKVVTIGSYQVAQRDNDANATIKPIPLEALPEAKKVFEEASVDQKLNLISSLIKQSGGVKNGKTIWGETLGQLSDGDQAYQMAGVARMNNFRSDAGLDVAKAIVAGKQALKNKQMVQPKEALMKEKFNQYVGQTVSGETANLTYSAFESIYAYLTEARGQTHKNADEYKEEIGKTALTLATGGVYSQGGKFKDYTNRSISNWKVSMPYSMKDDEFEKKINKGYADLSKATGMSVNELENFRLARSAVTGSNGDLMYDLINERGRPLVVNGAIWRIRMNGVTK